MSEGEQTNSLDKVDTFELENGMECAPDSSDKDSLICEDPETGELVDIDASETDL